MRTKYRSTGTIRHGQTIPALIGPAAGFAMGFVIAPRLVAMGFSLIGALSALIAIMLGWYFVGEFHHTGDSL